MEITKKPRLNAVLSPDRKALIITYADSFGASFTFLLSASEVTEFCEMLGNTRSLASPEVPREHPSHYSTVVNDPPMAVQFSEKEDRKLLSIRHPGFGWLSFLMSDASCQGIGDALSTLTSGRPRPVTDAKALH
jgi:hypothetical protein